MSDQSQALEAIDIPQFSKIDLTWPGLSVYIIQPALTNKPDIGEITNYPIGAGADKFEILLQTLPDHRADQRGDSEMPRFESGLVKAMAKQERPLTNDE